MGCGGGDIEINGKLEVSDFIKFISQKINNHGNNSRGMGASAHRQPQEQYSTMPKDTPPVKILRTPLSKKNNKNEFYPDYRFLFFGETSYMPNGNTDSITTCYKYVGIFMDNKIQEFRELLISSDSESCWISKEPISFEEIKKNDLDSLKKLKEFIISRKNNNTFLFCQPIIELLENI